MPTPEIVYCLVTTRARTLHLGRTERVREVDGAATHHRHNGLTLCGAKIEQTYPFVSANWVHKKRDAGACPDCLAKWQEDRRRQRHRSLVQAVLP